MLKEFLTLAIVAIYFSGSLAVCVIEQQTSGEIVGAISDASVSNPNVIEAANYAIDTEYGSATNYTLINAKQKVVAGNITYFLIVALEYSGQTCAIQMTYQSRLNQYTIDSTICDLQPGPFLQVNIQDQTVINQTNVAINRLYGYDREYQLESAQRLSVNGYMYNLIIRFLDNDEVCQIKIYSFINSQSIRSNTCSGAPSSLGVFPVTTPI